MMAQQSRSAFLGGTASLSTAAALPRRADAQSTKIGA
jgi:hypothetical protein